MFSNLVQTPDGRFENHNVSSHGDTIIHCVPNRKNSIKDMTVFKDNTMYELSLPPHIVSSYFYSNNQGFISNRIGAIHLSCDGFVWRKVFDPSDVSNFVSSDYSYYSFNHSSLHILAPNAPDGKFYFSEDNFDSYVVSRIPNDILYRIEGRSTTLYSYTLHERKIYVKKPTKSLSVIVYDIDSGVWERIDDPVKSSWDMVSLFSFCGGLYTYNANTHQIVPRDPKTLNPIRSIHLSFVKSFDTKGKHPYIFPQGEFLFIVSSGVVLILDKSFTQTFCGLQLKGAIKMDGDVLCCFSDAGVLTRYHFDENFKKVVSTDVYNSLTKTVEYNIKYTG